MAHNSGGPKMDIVSAPGTGFLARTLEEYELKLYEILSKNDVEILEIQTKARKHVVDKFNETQFKSQFNTILAANIDF